MVLDWDDLRTFLAIARHGSLSAAARTLGVRQTTMGRRLAALEARAGARLLQKTPRGYVLTDAGEAVLGNVERIEAETLAVERRITGRDVRLEGTVRITSVESFSAEILMPILAGLRQRHPGIAIEVVADVRNLSLTRREADVAMRMARPDQQDLTVRCIGRMGFGLYASPGYLETRGPPDFARGGEGHDVILAQPELKGMPELDWLVSSLPRAQRALQTNSRYGHPSYAAHPRRHGRAGRWCQGGCGVTGPAGGMTGGVGTPGGRGGVRKGLPGSPFVGCKLAGIEGSAPALASRLPRARSADHTSWIVKASKRNRVVICYGS